jgi:hypothetical protein
LRIPPVELVLLPHLPETIQTKTFPVKCILFQHLIKDILVKHLPTDLEERHQLRVLNLASHQQIQFSKNINDEILLILGFLDAGLGVDEGYD